ncbi:uncharacterized protein LOC143236007 [Tachypleus tridentatus]|uniref:uncharacterized protein LOC143236007 n=1 Tax=Tachypleus tridentatus TaxID=6853 RepID=UPI003FD5C8A7
MAQPVQKLSSPPVESQSTFPVLCFTFDLYIFKRLYTSQDNNKKASEYIILCSHIQIIKTNLISKLFLPTHTSSYVAFSLSSCKIFKDFLYYLFVTVRSDLDHLNKTNGSTRLISSHLLLRIE